MVVNEVLLRLAVTVSFSTRRAKHLACFAEAPCQARFAKIFPFLKIRKHDLTVPSRARKRDASRSSRTWSAGCDGRFGAAGGCAKGPRATPRGLGNATVIS